MKDNVITPETSTILKKDNAGSSTYCIAEETDNQAITYHLGRQNLTLKGFGIECYNVESSSSSYLEICRQFHSTLVKEYDLLIEQSQELPQESVLTSNDCHSIYDYESIEGKVVVLKKEVLFMEYQTISNQIFLATGGFGCIPHSRGNAVYAINLYDGKETRLERYDLEGVIKKEKMPQWATNKLKELEQPPKKKGMER